MDLRKRELNTLFLQRFDKELTFFLLAMILDSSDKALQMVNNNVHRDWKNGQLKANTILLSNRF